MSTTDLKPSDPSVRTVGAVCRADHVIEREVEDDLVLYDPPRDSVHVLNSTGAVVWWLIDGERAQEDITAQLARLFGKAPAEVASDVDDILSDLSSASLIVGG